MAERETVSERRQRLQEAKAAEEAAKAAAKTLGGLSGKAAQSLMGRKGQLDEALKKAGA